MSNFKVPLRLQLAVSRNGLVGVLVRPAYACVLYITFWLALGLLVWLTNWRLLASYATNSTHSLAEKFDFYASGYSSLLTNFEPLSASLLVVFALLTGLNAALLVFVIFKSVKEAALSGSKNIFALIAAAIGAGCAACGTSFLAPLLTGVSGALSLTLTMAIGILANILGLLLLGYSIFKLGQTAAGYIAKQL